MKKIDSLVKYIKFQVFLLLLFFFSSGYCQLTFSQELKDDLKIWFNQPADKLEKQILKSWEEESLEYTNKVNPDKAWHDYILPVGNGFMGAGIFGGVAVERIQLNDKTLWSGGPGVEGYYSPDQEDAYKHLKSIREKVLSGALDEADKQAKQVLTNNWEREELQRFFGQYQTFGELQFATGLDNANISNYRRELDLATGVVNVTFEQNKIQYKRECFCSYPDKCLVVRLTANKSNVQNIKLTFASPHKFKGEVEDKTWVISGNQPDNNMALESRIKAIAPTGTIINTLDGIEVRGANSVIFIVTIGTDYAMDYPTCKGDHPAKQLKKLVSAVSQKPYKNLKQRHLKDYQGLFNRVSLNLGASTLEQKALPTNLRLNANKKDVDPELESLYFQFGRYLLIASSRSGSLPANLQGVWCNEVTPAWNSDYHFNINLQMNYWPSGVTNLAECHQPLIDYIEFLTMPGAKTAKAYNNSKGWTANLSSNIWGYTSPNVKSVNPVYWTWFPMGGPWLSLHVWEQYAFTQDENYLRTQGYPIIKGAAEFLEGYVYKLPSGELSSCPSWSPEHGPVSKGAMMDIGVIFETLTNAIKAARVLGVDKEKQLLWELLKSNLVKYKIGNWGQLQEWYEDIDNPGDKHRHINHLFGLYPGTHINPIITTELAKAAKITLQHRGDDATGWSMGWKINFWTRLFDGDHAYKLFRNLLTKRTLPNLWDSHPPFQIDGNFGGTAGIAEMLLQSQTGIVHLLPALPSAWQTGEVTGLLARGGFEIDMKWEEEKLVCVKVKAKKTGICRLKYKDKTFSVKMLSGSVLKLNGSFENREK